MISDEELKKRLRILKIIWFGMMMSLAINFFVVIKVARDSKISLGIDTFTTLKIILYILAFIILFMTRYIKKYLLSVKGRNKQIFENDRYHSQQSAIGKYATAMIASCCMSLIIGEFGVILFLLGKGKNFMDLYLLTSISATAICIYYPKKYEINTLK